MADLGGTPILNANQTLSLDTGAIGTSGGDILWTGSSIIPQSPAAAANLGNIGAAVYGLLDQTRLMGYTYASAAIPVSSLVANDVFVVLTAGGHYAKVLVTAQSGASISLAFTTFGVSGGPSAGPSVSYILNNYGLILPGYPNFGIAPGSLFILVGSGLCDPNAQAVLESSQNGLPTTLNGATVEVTSGGVTVTPVFYYAIAAQLALVLPSNTPLGTASVTVTYNGQTSQPLTFQVVASAMGFDAYYGAGVGLGVATDNDTGFLYNYAHAIPPGTVVTLWGSGLGADPVRDTTYVASAFRINTLAHVYIGGIDATIYYQGASGYPGVNQVDIAIPLNAPTGCNVSLVGVTADGVPTNFLSLPIGNGTCSDSFTGANGATLQSLGSRSAVNTGAVSVTHSLQPGPGGTSVTYDQANAIFSSTTGWTYAEAAGATSVGSCAVLQYGSAASYSSGPSAGLNAGTVSVSGPSGAADLTASSIGNYSLLAAGFFPVGGTFNFTGGGAGVVGPFTTSVTLPSPVLVWSNQAANATITRSSGATFTWTDGAPGSYVLVTGTSQAMVNGATVGASFNCLAPQSAGSFTVPPYVLEALPAGSGTVAVGNSTGYSVFAAPGMDYGTATASVSQTIATIFN